ncbi:hypothetical protein GGS21DRAFT_495270 [Xylaria nigripes]|nr:hypothetical protein GGS21DRAFT_495270 [Xylaria nigripes]
MLPRARCGRASCHDPGPVVSNPCLQIDGVHLGLKKQFIVYDNEKAIFSNRAAVIELVHAGGEIQEGVGTIVDNPGV